MGLIDFYSDNFFISIFAFENALQNAKNNQKQY